MPEMHYSSSMEILMVKVQDGTKKKLRQLGGNMSDLVRSQIDLLLENRTRGSVHDRLSEFCGIIKGGPGDASTSKDYLKQYGKKRTA
jgi:hypothetical protein